jgi:Methyltransferase domain
MKIDPYDNDPGHWGASLATLSEILFACLDAVAPRSVIEVGAYAGDLTRLLLDWAAPSGAEIWAIDPSPQPALVRLVEERADLKLVRETSHEALRHVPRPGAAIIDGDHNYYTVAEELRLVTDGVPGAELPLLLFHDVAWPHARRDNYFMPDGIPQEYRHPMTKGAALFPGEPGLRAGGLPYAWAATHEGGPHNGVLTAIEDFVGEREGMRMAVVPAFFGFGAVWHRDAPWADEIAGLLDPWDRNPLLERLEANRVLHLASSHLHLTEANAAREKAARQEALLRRLLESSAFSVAERLSRLRMRLGIAVEQSAVSKEEVRRVLSD